MNLIYRYVREIFGEAGGPADLNGVYFCCGSQAEVDAHIVVGNVAGAAAHFVHELRLPTFTVMCAPMPSRLDFVPTV